jgi:mono/diheme cytochrome c family protein
MKANLMGEEAFVRKTRIFTAMVALVCAIGIAGAVQRASAAGDDESASEQYMVYCAKCHGPGGHGDGANASTLKTPPRNFSECATMTKISDNTMFTAIKEGGTAVNLPGDMPPWGQAFDDSEIKGLAAYVRAFCKK